MTFVENSALGLNVMRKSRLPGAKDDSSEKERGRGVRRESEKVGLGDNTEVVIP